MVVVSNDVFRFFFEAGSGIALAVLIFGVLPFYGVRSLARSIKLYIQSRSNRRVRHAAQDVQKA